MTPKAGGKVDKERPTQVGRALSQLGIEHIPSLFATGPGAGRAALRHAPEPSAARAQTGRDQRHRGGQPLHPRGLPAGLQRPIRRAGSRARLRLVAYLGPELTDILSIQEARQVQNDNTVRYHGLLLQIPEQSHRRHFVKASVRVHEYADGTLAVFHGPRCLGRYDQQGNLETDKSSLRAA